MSAFCLRLYCPVNIAALRRADLQPKVSYQLSAKNHNCRINSEWEQTRLHNQLKRNNNSIKFFIIYVLSQQLQGQLQT
jgi:hypothetical protein